MSTYLIVGAVLLLIIIVLSYRSMRTLAGCGIFEGLGAVIVGAILTVTVVGSPIGVPLLILSAIGMMALALVRIAFKP